MSNGKVMIIHLIIGVTNLRNSKGVDTPKFVKKVEI